MKTLIATLKIFLFFTMLTGLVYPLFVTGIARLLFPFKANGSIVFRDSRPVGSVLIGQQYDSQVYFSSRPSAVAYNPLPSGGSNLGLTSKRLKRAVDSCRMQFLRANKLDQRTNVPAEMLFSSASGLDPHISPEAAMLQLDRIAAARHFSQRQKDLLSKTIRQLTERPQLLFLGEKRVNVLLLNLATDKIQ